MKLSFSGGGQLTKLNNSLKMYLWHRYHALFFVKPEGQ